MKKAAFLLFLIIIPTLSILLLLFTHLLKPGVQAQTTQTSWYMAGANPQRTSWVAEQVPATNTSPNYGKLYPVWTKPIEPYIPNKVQIIGANSMIYLSTAKGLYAFDADTGVDKWVYATEMPLGHSPTYFETSFSSHPKRLYVGGLDHKIHAIDADTGVGIWTYEAKLDGIGAGFETNSLVLNIGGTIYIYAGNRDGYMYALKESSDGTSASLAWNYKTDGPIEFSAAASKDNTKIYFASNDTYAYALSATGGWPTSCSVCWKSSKLLGQGFFSYWPVVYTDSSTQKEYVLFSGASNYRANNPPGPNGNMQQIDREIWQGAGNYGDTGGVSGTLIGVRNTQGYLDTSQKDSSQAYSISSYYSTKPYRRTVFVIDSTSGQEVTSQYAPFIWNGTGGSNRFPALIMPDNLIYQSAGVKYRTFDAGSNINFAGILGWKFGTPLVTTPESNGLIVDEPVYYSGGGNIIYDTWHTDLEVDSFDVSKPNTNYGTIDGAREWVHVDQGNGAWPPLNLPFPGYQAAMDAQGGDTGGGTWYNINHGAFGPNGVYGRDGVGNPPVPYHGKVYLHKGNAVLAFSPTVKSSGTLLSTARTKTTNVVSFNTSVSSGVLKQKLEAEVQKIISAGHLRTAILHSGGLTDILSQQCGANFLDYFHNPGDTFWTLSAAFPYLLSGTQTSLVTYLSNEYRSYNPASLSNIGWAAGDQREWLTWPPDMDADRANYGPSNWRGDYEFAGWSSKNGNTNVPPYNFYALWKYAVATSMTQSQAASLLSGTGISKTIPPDSFLAQSPFVANAYLSGFYGYLHLQSKAGITQDSSVASAYQSLLTKRMTTFTKNVPASYPDAYCSALNISGNFLFLAPEVISDLQNLPSSSFNTNVLNTLNDYAKEAPYWFVSGFDDTINEGVHAPMYDTQLLQARAYILKDSRENLLKYLDVPMFKAGDLFYIQNLVAAIEAPSNGATPVPTATSGPIPTPTRTPTPNPACFNGNLGNLNCDSGGLVNETDLSIFLNKWTTTGPASTPGPGQYSADLNGDGKVDESDLSILLTHWKT